MTTGRITDEAIAALRLRIGLERPRRPWHETASKDAIKHFAHGIGDTNPLWTDENYAKKSKYGCIVAPPTFLCTFSSGPVWPPDPRFSVPEEQRRGGWLPGVGALQAGDEWEFFRPVRVDERITAAERLADVIEKPGSFGGRQVHEIRETLYRDERGELVGICRGRMIRMERDTAHQRGRYLQQFTKRHYTLEELRAIDEEYAREQRQGATPRYWEEVQEGEEIPQVIKGPLTSTDVVAFAMGWGSPYAFAHAIAHEYYRRHPGICIVDPETGVPDSAERIHWDDTAGRLVGVPAAFDIRMMRVSYFGHLMTNWMGDDGFLRKLAVQLRRPVIMGDTVRYRGKVTGKYVRDGEHLVECELWAENQRGEMVSPGSALVRLPSRIEG